MNLVEVWLVGLIYAHIMADLQSTMSEVEGGHAELASKFCFWDKQPSDLFIFCSAS